MPPREILEGAFAHADTNEDGAISAAEVKAGEDHPYNCSEHSACHMGACCRTAGMTGHDEMNHAAQENHLFVEMADANTNLLSGGN
jgi:ferredoxin